MAITASMVKELREMTGAGMMDCKKALNETNGDMSAAVEFLRKNGQAKAEKKAGRIAAEGIVKTIVKDDKVAAIVEVNSETDFVAKNEKFQDFVTGVAETIVNSNAADVEALLGEAWEAEEEFATVKDALVGKIAVIGENLTVRRFEKIVAEEGCVVPYIHGGGRIGVLVEAKTDAVNDEVKAALKNIAMQVAAMRPEYISRDDISAAELAKLREITVDASLNDPANLPKPILKALIAKACEEKLWSEEDIAIYEEKQGNNYLFNFLSKEAPVTLSTLAMADKENIMANKIFNGAIEGRVSKQLKESCLLDQTYVKAEDGKQTVGAYLKSVNKDLVIKNVVRFEVGEGIEKKVDDFAAEVAAQAGL